MLRNAPYDGRDGCIQIATIKSFLCVFGNNGLILEKITDNVVGTISCGSLNRSETLIIWLVHICFGCDKNRKEILFSLLYRQMEGCASKLVFAIYLCISCKQSLDVWSSV